MNDPYPDSGDSGPVVMFKLGGSLLTLPDLGCRVREVLHQRPQSRPLLVVGGGAAADLVREWDRIHRLGDEVAHRLAIRAMGATAMLAASVIDRARLVAHTEELPAAWERDELPVLLVEPILAALEAESDDRLPASWDVTSDAIAAWLAIRLGAAELVLLKSVDLPPEGLDAAAGCGLVDPHFPRLAHRLPRVTWVNLRSGR